MGHLGVGDKAPDFTLPGTDGTPDGTRDYRLSECAGHPVVLVFYPADNSPVCTIQLNTYTADIGQFSDLGAKILAISPQSVDDHQSFISNQDGFAFPLLSDSDKHVGGSYGVLGPVGFYRRSVFVLDSELVVRYAHRSVAGLAFRSTDELVGVLASLAA